MRQFLETRTLCARPLRKVVSYPNRKPGLARARRSMHEHKRSRIMRNWSVPAHCGILGDRKSATLAHKRRMTYACAHTVQWCAVAPEASQFAWRQELCDATAPLLVPAPGTLPHICAAELGPLHCSSVRQVFQQVVV